VDVQVDEPGHHVHPGRVDLVLALRRLSGLHDPVDLVVLDDDVDRASRLASGPVDQRRPADHERAERAEALVRPAVGRREQPLLLRASVTDARRP
jgi:hypothetical protein